MEQLEDEATTTHAELQGGDRVVEVAAEGGAPLNVETDDEAVEPAAVDLLDFGEPAVGHERRIGDQGLNLVAIEENVVVVMAEVGKHADDADHGGTAAQVRGREREELTESEEQKSKVCAIYENHCESDSGEPGNHETEIASYIASVDEPHRQDVGMGHWFTSASLLRGAIVRSAAAVSVYNLFTPDGCLCCT